MFRINEDHAKVVGILGKAIESALKLQEKSMHGSRISFLELVLPAIIAARSVQYVRIAAEMKGDALVSSKEKRIHRFIDGYDFNDEFVFLFVLFLLPKKGKLRLSIDRTEWEFGGNTHNLLTVTVYSHGVGVPIWVENVASNGGCSDADDKQYVIMKCVDLIGKGRIKCVIGDSEFIGDEWIAYLYDAKIRFFFDIRSNQYFEYERQRHSVAGWMRGRYKSELKGIKIFGKTLNIGIKRQKLSDKHKRKPFLAIVTNCPDTNGILSIYRNRWSIEVFFQSIKERGFHLEDTHLTDPIEIRRLFMLLCMAFALCFRIGIVIDKVRPIPLKNHGYKANSFFRTGLEFVATLVKANSRISHQKQIMDALEALFVTILAPDD